jgi:hypothetical protein
LPQEITLVQFGPSDSKKISDYHYYEKCVDDDVVSSSQLKFSFKNVFSKVYTFVKNIFGFVFGDDETILGDTPGYLGEYGTKSCSHSNLVTNKQFLDYISNVMSSYQNYSQNEINSGESLNESGLEKLIYECYPVTCHNDFDKCYDSFLKLVYE